jgi:hypothetical protein
LGFGKGGGHDEDFVSGGSSAMGGKILFDLISSFGGNQFFVGSNSGAMLKEAKCLVRAKVP